MSDIVVLVQSLELWLENCRLCSTLSKYSPLSCEYHEIIIIVLDKRRLLTLDEGIAFCLLTSGGGSGKNVNKPADSKWDSAPVPDPCLLQTCCAVCVTYFKKHATIVDLTKRLNNGEKYVFLNDYLQPASSNTMLQLLFLIVFLIPIAAEVIPCCAAVAEPFLLVQKLRVFTFA